MARHTARKDSMTDDDFILALDATGWTLETSPQSDWVVVKRGSHVFAGHSLRDVATRIQRQIEDPKEGEENA